MTSWLNPRAIVIVLSVLLLVEATANPAAPDVTIRRDTILCVALFLAYAAAFLVPLRLLGVKRLLTSLLFLGCGWAAVALALVVDATPLPPDEALRHPWPWPRTLFAAGAILAFLLFFDAVHRLYRERDELLEARREPNWR